jgi:hypothetical protein
MNATETQQESTNIVLTKKDVFFLLGYKPTVSGHIKTANLRRVLFTDAFLMQLGMSVAEYKKMRTFTVHQSHIIRNAIRQ